MFQTKGNNFMLHAWFLYCSSLSGYCIATVGCDNENKYSYRFNS